MSEKLLLPPKHVLPEKYRGRKIFFLAGPIRGGGYWQIRAADILWKLFDGCVVVDPTRWESALASEKDPKLKKRIAAYLAHAIGTKDEVHYLAQAPWEDEHMRAAAEKGKLLFWLERESPSHPRPKNEGVYAQDTRVETGIWIERLKHEPHLKVAFGGTWKINDKGQETRTSFGGMNFIAYYLTGVQDRRKLYSNEVQHPRLIRAKSVEEFVTKATSSD